MKLIAVALVVICWAAYCLGHDRKPVPKWMHPGIHLFFLALTVTVWVAL